MPVASGVIGHSEGNWASCTPCHELIARRDWQGLHDRAVRSLKRKHPELDVAAIKQAVKGMHAQFRAHQP